MNDLTLQKARAYEAEHGAAISPAERPAYHMTPYVGWLNDPNGFSYYKGKYHQFYQYNPYDVRWAPMHWGHAVSTDLLHWEYLPCALAPDSPADNGPGCFSGSATQMDDGRQLLMYTSDDDRGDTIARFGGDDGGALRDGNALLGLILGLIARQFGTHVICDSKADKLARKAINHCC